MYWASSARVEITPEGMWGFGVGVGLRLDLGAFSPGYAGRPASPRPLGAVHWRRSLERARVGVEFELDEMAWGLVFAFTPTRR